MSGPFRRLVKVYRAFHRDCVAAFAKLRGSGEVASHGVKGQRRLKLDFRKAFFGASIFSTTCGALIYFLDNSVRASEMTIEIPSLPWTFETMFRSFDHSALRRGWLVYKTVCRTCHGLQFLRFGDLVNVTHTAEEVKAFAAEFEIDDGPDAEGNYYKRPCKLSDRVPDPYPNEEAARAVNFGAHPPDLTYVVRARKNGINYVFALLTGYMDAPAGVTLNEGQHFNAYFPGGATGMAEMFADGMLDYDDGTPATSSQMAKDVVEFLCWTSAQEHDTRMLMMIKAFGITLILLGCILHIHRRYCSYLRSRQISHIPRRQ